MYKKRKIQFLLRIIWRLAGYDISKIHSKAIIHPRALHLRGIKGTIIIDKNCLIEGKIIFFSKNATVKIDESVFMNGKIMCFMRVEIKKYSLISWGVTIIDSDTHSIYPSLRSKDLEDWLRNEKDWSSVRSKSITIMDNCWIGFNAVILKGVTIPSRTIVGASSVVTKTLRKEKANMLIAGNPATTKKHYD